MNKLISIVIFLFVTAFVYDYYNFNRPPEFKIDNPVYERIVFSQLQDTIYEENTLENRILLVKLDQRYCNRIDDYSIRLFERNSNREIEGKLIYLDEDFNPPFFAFDNLTDRYYQLLMKDRSGIKYNNHLINMNTLIKTISTSTIRKKSIETVNDFTTLGVYAAAATRPNLEMMIHYYKDTCLSRSIGIYNGDYAARCIVEDYNPNDGTRTTYTSDPDECIHEDIWALSKRVSEKDSTCFYKRQDQLIIYHQWEETVFRYECGDDYILDELEKIIQRFKTK